MKKKIISLIIGLCAITTTLPISAKEVNFPNLRTAQGTYYDYLVVETTDGNEWLLGDEPESKYLDNNGNAIFTDKESVIVLFDTMGTETVEDDVILDVHSLD